MTRNWMIAIFVAAMMFLPSALAIESGLGGASGSSTVSFSSAAGNNVDMTSALGAQSMVNSGAFQLAQGGNVYDYRTSGDGKQKAYAYAYLDSNVIYTYNFAGSSSSTTATVNMDVTALPIAGVAAQNNHFLLGGFAFNSKDYAATYVSGFLSDSIAAVILPPTAAVPGGKITYKNSLYASPSKVSATESFYGSKLEQVRAETWAERGNLASEVVDKTGTDLMWADVTNAVPVKFRGPYYDQGNWQSGNELYSGQWMETESFGYSGAQTNIASSKPYTATASLASNVASSSQSASLTVAPTTASPAAVKFESYGLKGTLTSGSDAFTGLDSDFPVGARVTYSGKSTASAAQQTATQTEDVNVPVALAWGSGIIATSRSNDYTNELVSVGQLMLNPVGGNAFATYLAGTDSAATKTGSASTTMKVTKAMGEQMDRLITADSNLGDVHAAASSSVPTIGTTVGTLAGQSTATATLNKASVLSNGKWTAGIAVGGDFRRVGDASSNGLALTWTLTDTRPVNAGIVKKLYQFADKVTATSTALVVA